MPTDAEPLNLEAIKKRAGAATAGPWFAASNGSVTHAGLNTAHYGSAWGTYVAPSTGAHSTRKPTDADARFIAAARSDVPALVAEVERLRAEVEFQQAASGEAGRDDGVLREQLAETQRQRDKAERIASERGDELDRIDLREARRAAINLAAVAGERISTAERDVIEAARAWRHANDGKQAWDQRSYEAKALGLAAAVDALPGLDRDNETPEGSDA